MWVTQAYRFALNPTPAQRRALASHAGAARFAWNWALAACITRHQTEGKWWSGTELHRLWNQAKKTDPALGWWAENSKCVYQEAFRDLDRALREFVRSRNGRRKGRRLGFPRFKRRGRCRDSFRFSTGAMRCAGRTVTLPRLGTIGTHESTRKLARRLEGGTARVLSATVSRTAHRWHVSFTVQVDRAVPTRHARPGSAVGVDLGVRTLLTGVDDRGAVIEVAGPKALRAGLRKLARRMLDYKTGWNAGKLVVADRWFPSSKTCSGCGRRKPSLSLSERLYRCEGCGLVVGRDVNAARNLLVLAASGAESRNACGGGVSPGLAGRPPVKQEPGATPGVGDRDCRRVSGGCPSSECPHSLTQRVTA
ncbi:RNA-guided endonuclease TnpB family protein [Actinomadura meridiana]|uniref:RNA-guided endonuclease TnpB family protein n=1 Tax=Actinomadura meridiana TaxID=559626 RepID=UPI0031E9F100